MQRSKVECYIHFVWATRNREPFLTPKFERIAYRCMKQEIERLQCVPLAIGGMPDHVHCVVQLHSTVSIARMAQAMKGTSSKFLNNEAKMGQAFDWQDHYGAFSVSRSHLKRVLRYVNGQKQHHELGKLWSEWEETEIHWDLPATDTVP
ncbi:IS200/IS605 family transposase [bacterium]|nr:MAG: IS200/IS605 family transposase [bacterium]